MDNSIKYTYSGCGCINCYIMKPKEIGHTGTCTCFGDRISIENKNLILLYLERLKNDIKNLENGIAININRENIGCQSHSCYLERPTGMGTNGPCGCVRDIKPIKNKQNILSFIKYLNNKIEILKDK